jgi:hypothetical protein
VQNDFCLIVDGRTVFLFRNDLADDILQEVPRLAGAVPIEVDLSFDLGTAILQNWSGKMASSAQ